MRRAVHICLGLMALCLPGAAQALCDVTYKVQPGDTLFTIAETHYDDREKWTLIYYANQDVLNGVDQIAMGLDVYIPCPTGVPPSETTQTEGDESTQDARLQQQGSAAQTPAQTQVQTAEMLLLTGGNYAPFTDQSWPGQGMATELVNAALGATPSPVTYVIGWEDDWSQHLFPLLDSKSYDMGFPWVKPDCAALPDHERCANFHFSDPLMDLPIMLFKRADSDLVYTADADIPGLTLCRPAGYFTHDLDRVDRRWLSDGRITLVQPDSPEACFDALMAGEVDAVTLNVFLGATKIVTMGLRGEVVPIDDPISREQLHVIISKSHWRGTTHLYRINAGLAALRESGAYNEIVERHLEIFWDQLE